MSNKVFVGGLSWNTKEDTLEGLFAEVGEISSVKTIYDRETGRSRGFGFVEFSSENDALTAVEKLDGAELDGRNLKVSIAQERKPRTDRNSGNNNRSFNSRW